MKLFRVYTHTLGDESITERLVAANTKEEASVSALANVKAQNLGKGNTPQSESKENTTILSIKECGKNGVLATNRIPVASLALMATALFSNENSTMNDFKNDMRMLAGLPEESSLEEVTMVLSSMVKADEPAEPEFQPA